MSTGSSRRRPGGRCDAAHEVARGWETLQITDTFFINDEDGIPATFDASGVFTTQRNIRRSRSFEIDGRRVRIPRGAQSGNGAFHVDNACVLVDNACPTWRTYFKVAGEVRERD